MELREEYSDSGAIASFLEAIVDLTYAMPAAGYPTLKSLLVIYSSVITDNN
ncbi:hypothetical protein COO91_00324 [Nostoc flagelliforme CCNUN1]|uniref:Uncharacterized protein n=1 Tax=Nostoc flagelliforme CCNUN1 TaxID=2038116 RepID=A0A2K8SGB1_9NOSO|nr:hypothetical protein [Nostoc flagelliforme]AUB34501.1 hypothetical protein COO91_00324 [Nostoc flagelliforme CCNUN1]